MNLAVIIPAMIAIVGFAAFIATLLVINDRSNRTKGENVENPQLPTVGRIVHAQFGESALPMVAIITQIHDSEDEFSPGPGNVELTVFPPRRTRNDGDSDTFTAFDVPYSAELKPGHWTWPPRA